MNNVEQALHRSVPFFDYAVPMVSPCAQNHRSLGSYLLRQQNFKHVGPGIIFRSICRMNWTVIPAHRMLFSAYTGPDLQADHNSGKMQLWRNAPESAFFIAPRSGKFSA